VTFNCVGLNSDLIERKLFGYEKGSSRDLLLARSAALSKRTEERYFSTRSAIYPWRANRNFYASSMNVNSNGSEGRSRSK
jgi:hypothetical protein